MIDYQEREAPPSLVHKLPEEWTSPAAEITQTTLKRKWKILISSAVEMKNFNFLRRGSNPQSSDQEPNALPTELPRLSDIWANLFANDWDPYGGSHVDWVEWESYDEGIFFLGTNTYHTGRNPKVYAWFSDLLASS